ncbi:hypothetical protein F443_18128 [Phytophthora nicotianae P1569]|uniref:Uncharacterized protein n=1 Tax=Phytophthora nicotianae P1569 TaxID=1317065 RepID=V9E8V9_PHYNI|nr:hypothetical protein F443_18128 [Phytophthora nicotianae P1569]
MRRQVSSVGLLNFRASSGKARLYGSKKDALIVEVQPSQRSGVAVESEAVQLEKLLDTLEWKEPKRLCASSGQDWPYQGAPELVDLLVKPLIKHYNAWHRYNEDKQNHAINLVLGGAGTGKSRTLDEMKGLLSAAAARSKNQALLDRMNSAYVFHVTFGNGTSPTGSLLDRDNPDYDVSYRMLYQLAKDRRNWKKFAKTLKTSYQSLELTIEASIDVLAKLEEIDSVRDMTVILCVDGLQKLVNRDSKSCRFGTFGFSSEARVSSPTSNAW